METIQGVSIMWLEKRGEEQGVNCRALHHLEIEKVEIIQQRK